MRRNDALATVSLRQSLSDTLARHWWRTDRSWLAWALAPIEGAVHWLTGFHRARSLAQAATLPVPVIVVGNLIVGGAGKTPTVMALLQWLREQGWRPAVVSRGYGRDNDSAMLVHADTPASQCGDEPLLIHRRSTAPVMVGRDRLAAARQLLARHPEVNVLVSDDGLQHWRLPRDVQVVVFDARGVGNGRTLPAGPLREPMAASPPPRTLVLYNAEQASTAWPGSVARRQLAGAVALADWWGGAPPRRDLLSELARRSRISPLLACAGMGQPERFFGMLEDADLRITRLPLPDHADFTTLPWPADTTDLLLTEKDAVKLPALRVSGTRVWVVALDFALPEAFTQALRQWLGPPPTGT